MDHAATFPNKILPTPVIVFLVNDNAIAYIVHQQLMIFTQCIITVFLFTVYPLWLYYCTSLLPAAHE